MPSAERTSAAPFVPPGADLDGLRAAARGCRGCELYQNASQTVFGAGSPRARMVLVGEQPGDAEDRKGLPFVGPAGRLLDRALDEVGVGRSDVYLTNVVKHFRFVQSGPGGRRIHRTPDAAHIAACGPWLTAELAVLDPEILVCLGATAARALLGPQFRVSRQRGLLVPGPDSRLEELAARPDLVLLATVHPSAVLRADDRDAAYQGFVADLLVAAGVLR